LRAVDADIRLLHLFTEPLPTSQIIERFFPGVCVGADAAPPVSYAFRSKYHELYGGRDGYIYSREQVLDQMEAFISAYRRGDLE
jgi:hypothetical protein